MAYEFGDFTGWVLDKTGLGNKLVEAYDNGNPVVNWMYKSGEDIRHGIEQAGADAAELNWKDHPVGSALSFASSMGNAGLTALTMGGYDRFMQDYANAVVERNPEAANTLISWADGIKNGQMAPLFAGVTVDAVSGMTAGAFEGIQNAGEVAKNVSDEYAGNATAISEQQKGEEKARQAAESEKPIVGNSTAMLEQQRGEERARQAAEGAHTLIDRHPAASSPVVVILPSQANIEIGADGAIRLIGDEVNNIHPLPGTSDRGLQRLIDGTVDHTIEYNQIITKGTDIGAWFDDLKNPRWVTDPVLQGGKTGLAGKPSFENIVDGVHDAVLDGAANGMHFPREYMENGHFLDTAQRYESIHALEESLIHSERMNRFNDMFKKMGERFQAGAERTLEYAKDHSLGYAKDHAQPKDRTAERMAILENAGLNLEQPKIDFHGSALEMN